MDLVAAVLGATIDPMTLVASVGLALLVRRWWFSVGVALALAGVAYGLAVYAHDPLAPLMGWGHGLGSAADAGLALGLRRLLAQPGGASPPAAE